MTWLRRRDEGQAAIEFLLIIPTFMLFLFLIVDFGMLTYEYVSIANAAREGARYAAVNCNPPYPGGVPGACTVPEVQTRVIERSGRVLTSANVGEISVGWTPNSGRGASVTVFINHPYTFWFSPAGPSIPVMSCADMRLERTDRTTGLPAGIACTDR
jgi:hypothetical protein